VERVVQNSNSGTLSELRNITRALCAWSKANRETALARSSLSNSKTASTAGPECTGERSKVRYGLDLFQKQGKASENTLPRQGEWYIDGGL